MWTSQNLNSLLGKTFKHSAYTRNLYLSYSPVWDCWNICFVGANCPIHETYKETSAKKVCDFLNNEKYTFLVIGPDGKFE